MVQIKLRGTLARKIRESALKREVSEKVGRTFKEGEEKEHLVRGKLRGRITSEDIRSTLSKKQFQAAREKIVTGIRKEETKRRETASRLRTAKGILQQIAGLPGKERVKGMREKGMRRRLLAKKPRFSLEQLKVLRQARGGMSERRAFAEARESALIHGSNELYSGADNRFVGRNSPRYGSGAYGNKHDIKGRHDIMGKHDILGRLRGRRNKRSNGKRRR